jgi:DMSO reductase anchor subunit
MGAFALLTLGAWSGLQPLVGLAAGPAFLPTLIFMIVLTSFGLFKLSMHLGKPHRFYRGFYNLRLSPVSREIAGVSMFFTGLVGYGLSAAFHGTLASMLNTVFAVIGLSGAAIGGWFMYRLYRIPARPFWDHWQTGASFLGTAMTLGGLLLALGAMVFGQLSVEFARSLAILVAAGLSLEGVGLLAHARSLQARGDEGAASFYEQSTSFGYPYWLRNLLLSAGVILAAGIAMLGSANVYAFGALALVALVSAIIGRALFYVVVMPTTMPGAFFWKNAQFVEHAREVGLADMPQLGVAYEHHHPFKLGELLETIRSTSFSEAYGQLKRIVTG